ncbi:hypothetical protein [Ciceribacter sp. RN22]|uniref:hypothetical protein n=1 Tax=Ciceribacter sp. RN22 TaxID=2954932 RepID=UPI002093CD67|nr:hypothetical protein [Ciceribacter sp. RN22]MCO6180263.1 hypothetical protein [Ciceribacter sp. RN22]
MQPANDNADPVANYDALAAELLTAKMTEDLRRLPEGLPFVLLHDLIRYGSQMLNALSQARALLEEEAASGDQVDPRVLAHAMRTEFFLRHVCGAIADEIERRRHEAEELVH